MKQANKEEQKSQKMRMIEYAMKHHANRDIIEGIKLGEYRTLKQLKKYLE